MGWLSGGAGRGRSRSAPEGLHRSGLIVRVRRTIGVVLLRCHQETAGCPGRWGRGRVCGSVGPTDWYANLVSVDGRTCLLTHPCRDHFHPPCFGRLGPRVLRVLHGVVVGLVERELAAENLPAAPPGWLNDEDGTRRVHLSQHYSESKREQQARNFLMDLGDRVAVFKLLIRDRDSEFTGVFDAVFASENIHILRTPVRAPRANAIAERWIAPHRALNQAAPLQPLPSPTSPYQLRLRRRDRLGA